MLIAGLYVDSSSFVVYIGACVGKTEVVRGRAKGWSRGALWLPKVKE